MYLIVTIHYWLLKWYTLTILRHASSHKCNWNEVVGLLRRGHRVFLITMKSLPQSCTSPPHIPPSLFCANSHHDPFCTWQYSVVRISVTVKIVNETKCLSYLSGYWGTVWLIKWYPRVLETDPLYSDLRSTAQWLHYLRQKQATSLRISLPGANRDNDN